MSLQLFRSSNLISSTFRRSAVVRKRNPNSPTYIILTATGLFFIGLLLRAESQAARSAAGRATGPYATQRDSPLAAPHAIAKVTSASAFLSVHRPPP